MRFVPFDAVRERLHGKTVAIVGSAPSCMDNRPGHVDSHDVVVRVNSYKLGEEQGRRTDVHYSFYGHSIKKTAQDLRRDGVGLCICKCPDSQPMHSDWHVRMGKTAGIDFRYIYKARAPFWFCDTYVPDDARFLSKVALLGGHIPTTGFAAILDVLDCQPKSIYLTGFDFFESGMHNVDERWRPGDPSDPIGHRPQAEAQWVQAHAAQFLFDRRLRQLLGPKK